MLQWMGGSRQKVTTSRKSTHKRQKQYFEQRKRQQLQTTGLETFSDGVTTSGQCQNYNRSLDILSLLNLPKVVQNHKSSCHSARENPEDSALKKNYHTVSLQTIQSNKVKPSDHIESKEERNPSGCQVGTVYPNKVLSSAPGSLNIDLIGHGDKMDQLKMTSERQLSVFDLLGDDGPNDNLEGRPRHEAHVAFAVEGLGKVGIETHVHSPQKHGRIFSYDSSSPLKASRQPQSFKNLNNLVYDLELETGAMVQDNDSGSFLELPFFSKGIANSFSKPMQKLSTVKECSQFNSNAHKLKNPFADDEIFYNIEDENDDIWKGISNFVDGNSWKDRPHKLDESSVDYWNLGNHEMSDFDLEGPNLKKIKVTEKATGRFNISESPVPHSKQRRIETDYDFLTPDGTWYPKLGIDCDLRDITNQPAWSCYGKEDAGESLSLSEESCSSSAVRGKATKRSPLDSVARHNIRRHSWDIRSPANKCSVENIYPNDIHYERKIKEPGTYTKISDPPNSNPGHFLNDMFPIKAGQEDRFLFKEEYISADRDSGFSSFCRTLGVNKLASADPKFRIDDPFGAYPLPEVHANVNSSRQGSKHDFLHDFSPPGNFPSEKFAFWQPYSHEHSCETPVFTTIRSGRSKPNFCMDSKVGSELQELFPVRGSQEDAVEGSVEGSVVKNGETKSEIHPTDYVKLELQKDICIGSNDLSSENGQALEAPSLKDDRRDYKEAKDLNPEMENQKATGSPEHAEESSSVTKPDKFEDKIDEKEYHNDAQAYPPCQNGSTEVGDSGPKEKQLESKGPNTSLDPSCQVMMLESYVLQLLCVQKVTKEASGHQIVKKV